MMPKVEEEGEVAVSYRSGDWRSVDVASKQVL